MTLRISVRMSSEAWVASIDDQPISLVGIGEILSHTGVPWMVSTPALTDHPMAVMRTSREWIRAMRVRYRLLRNYVDERNVIAKRWLKWLGFELGAPEPYGPLNYRFHPFEMRS